MRRERGDYAQRDLEWTDTMHREDLPAAVRERVGERLAQRGAASGRPRPPRTGGEA
jgi:hypothetical protein